MSEVLNMLPRVVHPIDVQTNSVYVNGRNWHYLCGVTAIGRSRHHEGEERNFSAVYVTSKAVLYVSRGKIRGPHQLTFLAMG